ncbi:MAG: hypothetical protein KGR26_09005 [Cyanobacteria bacterium REEB65]|nr:hypothetical protein [Cyanobacteria bacterium REEB65]
MVAETAHTRRLRTDFEKVQALVGRMGEVLQLEGATGTPPTKYRLRYRCKSVERVDEDQAMFRSEHQVEIQIPSGYPLEPPTVRILTPIWHPHVFSGGQVCLGSRWQVGEGLDNLLTRISAILRFEPDYLDFRSPANLEAAHWAAAHRGDFPLEPGDAAEPASPANTAISWQDQPAE